DPQPTMRRPRTRLTLELLNLQPSDAARRLGIPWSLGFGHRSFPRCPSKKIIFWPSWRRGNVDSDPQPTMPSLCTLRLLGPTFPQKMPVIPQIPLNSSSPFRQNVDLPACDLPGNSLDLARLDHWSFFRLSLQKNNSTFRLTGHCVFATGCTQNQKVDRF